MKRILTITLALVLVLPGLSLAAMKDSGSVVGVSAQPGQIEVAAGQPVEFAIKLDIQKKWHLYAHEDSMFIGVDLVPDEGFPLTGFQVEYPAGHEGEFFGEKVVMISGRKTIQAAGTVPDDLTAGEHVLALKVTVQACDDKTCLAPAYLPVTVKLTVK